MDEVAARVSFTLETSVLLCALGVDRAVFERGGFWEWFGGFRGGIWVKPEVDPPRVCDEFLGGGKQGGGGGLGRGGRCGVGRW